MSTCFIFDLDGTLFDSSEANTASYSAAFQAVGIIFNENAYKSNFGLRFDEMIVKLAPEATEDEKQEIQKHKAIYYKNNLNLVRPNEGLLYLLRNIRPHFKTALVTTARKENVLNVLGFFKIETSLFDCIVTGEDVQAGKPDPECYLKAMEKLAAKPEDCCVFEDSDVGIRAARQAGAQVIKVVL